ncbi:MAG: translation initiation factor IF-2 N-terminal domain-containing protein, partial [Akkermansia sp.]|nr:translation initiation factor IF-2 N-terminal domain-containing protein [Akkermansia sp.]
MAKNDNAKAPVLDLIGGARKKKASVPTEEATPAPARKPAAKAVAAAPKKEALDLLAPRKNNRKAEPAAAAPAPEPKPVPAPKSAPAPAPAPTAEPAAGSGKVMNIKAPITVADLATQMGMKPFKLIAELLPMGVFANPGTTLDSDQVAALCEKHGFTYERVRREKGAGVKAPVEEIKEPEAVAVEEEPEDALKVRTPIITVMGHVDHG